MRNSENQTKIRFTWADVSAGGQNQEDVNRELLPGGCHGCSSSVLCVWEGLCACCSVSAPPLPSLLPHRVHSDALVRSLCILCVGEDSIHYSVRQTSCLDVALLSPVGHLMERQLNATHFSGNMSLHKYSDKTATSVCCCTLLEYFSARSSVLLSERIWHQKSNMTSLPLWAGQGAGTLLYYKKLKKKAVLRFYKENTYVIMRNPILHHKENTFWWVTFAVKCQKNILIYQE